MTLGTIFGSILGPSISPFADRPSAGHQHELPSERNSDHYLYGSRKRYKGKSKSDKKHAVLSALTLLAFLFFLNILQSCVREQNSDRGTVMMFATGGATAPTGHQAKDPNADSKYPENPLGKRREADASPPRGRRSRSLLGISDETRRQVKFIRNFSSVNNWTKELSQMSDKDLDEQKLKTSNFPLYWKNSRFASAEPRPGPLSRNETVFRRFTKRERTSESPEAARVEDDRPTVQKTRERKKTDKFQPSLYIPEVPKNEGRDRTRNEWPSKKNATATPDRTPNAPTTDSGTNDFAATPRNRRSEHVTVRPGDYDEYDGYERTGVDVRTAAPAVGLDLNTFQTFPVYNYYDRGADPRGENRTADAPDATTPEIDRTHGEFSWATTRRPLFRPIKTSVRYPGPALHEHGNGYPVHRGGHHPVRTRHPAESRYGYSPYRRAGAYEAPHHRDRVRDDRHPPAAFVKYEVQHDEPGFDLAKFLWAMVASFAKPLTRLVPGFAKDDSEEAQCYDLLVCEAQRVSRFAGPTAEALAATIGTMLTWAATEETRRLVVDAINSGRENTCQQQIRDCEDRSGGKSAMTVIAQVLEMKLR